MFLYIKILDKMQRQLKYLDDIFTLWEHGLASLPTFSEHLNTMDKTGKTKDL